MAQGLASWVREIAEGRDALVQKPVASFLAGVHGDGSWPGSRRAMCRVFVVDGLVGRQPGRGPCRSWHRSKTPNGIDGSSPHAGVLLSPQTLAEAQARGVSARAALDRNDSLAVFEPLAR